MAPNLLFAFLSTILESVASLKIEKVVKGEVMIDTGKILDCAKMHEIPYLGHVEGTEKDLYEDGFEDGFEIGMQWACASIRNELKRFLFEEVGGKKPEFEDTDAVLCVPKPTEAG